MKKICWIFVGLLLTQSACDLQPKIVSLPDTVGDFISARYPALLADPTVNPEIYNSAVTDYGVYASPDLYGTSDTDDYVLYASVDDYIVPPQADDSVVTEGEPVTDDAKSDDVVVATKNDVPQMTDYLLVPMYGGPEYASQGTEDVLKIGRPVSGVRTATRVELTDVTVGVGDTLYSLSRKYSVPVNDLAVLNELQPPFALRVGQKIRVPNLASAPVASVKAVEVKQVKSEPKTVVVDDKKVQKPAVQTVQKVATVAPKKEAVTSQKVVAKQEQKISSDPSKKLPKIAARSSSKFQWPVRGKVLSAYGAKSNGLFNDGINIGASRGTSVVAAENGVVAYAGNEVKGMGNLIIMQHDGGWMTVYAHMDTMSVRRGAKIAVGQKIGTVGKTGKVDQPQLHFEIRKGTKAYNPSEYLKR